MYGKEGIALGVYGVDVFLSGVISPQDTLSPWAILEHEVRRLMCVNSHTFRSLWFVLRRQIQITNECGIAHRTLVKCTLHRTHVNVGTMRSV